MAQSEVVKAARALRTLKGLCLECPNKVSSKSLVRCDFHLKLQADRKKKRNERRRKARLFNRSNEIT